MAKRVLPSCRAGRPPTRGAKVQASEALQGRMQALARELSDTSQLGKRGEALTLAQISGVALCVAQPAWVDTAARVLGSVSIAAGLGIIALASNDLGDMLSPFPKPRRGELIDSGLYRYIAHPMYSGLVVSTAGVAIASASPGRGAAVLLLYAILRKKMDEEERLLAESVSGYSEYLENTPRLWPKRSMLLEGKQYSTGEGDGSSRSALNASDEST